MPPTEVDVITIRSEPLSRTVQFPGRLQSVRTAQVRARVEGIVEKRLYTEGTDVKAGDELFHIDPALLAANVAVAKAKVAEKQADAFVAAQTLERLRALLNSKAISTQQFDETAARKKQAEAGVAAAQAALTRAEIDLNYATVRAPIDGRIGRAMVTEGALVGDDEATHLTTIEQVDPIWVNFAQSSADYLKFRRQIFGEQIDAAQGKMTHKITVTLLLEDGTDYPLPGTLLFTDFGVDINTGSIGMRAEFPNPAGALLPGQFVGIRLPFAGSEISVAVPQRAVLASPQGQLVYRVDAGNHVEAVPVEVGGLAGSEWIIKKGLNEGDKIIVNGLQKVRPGAEVKPVPLVDAPQAAAYSNSKPHYAGTDTGKAVNAKPGVR